MSRRVAIPCALLAATLTVGCEEGSGPLQVRENAFAWSDHVPSGATVTVRDLNGDITVQPSADDTVRVTARLEWHKGNPDETLRMSGSRLGDDALICAVWGDGACSRDNYTSKWNGSSSSTDAKVFFQVSVPAGVKLDLQGANGNIVAAASAPVSARTMSGNVTVATAVGPARGETLNGSVDLRIALLSGTDSVIAKTLNGNVYVYLSELTDASIDLAATTGSVSSEFPVEITGEMSKRSLRAVLGAGTHPIRLRSMNGSVSIRRLDAAGKSYQPDGN